MTIINTLLGGTDTRLGEAVVSTDLNATFNQIGLLVDTGN